MYKKQILLGLGFAFMVSLAVTAFIAPQATAQETCGTVNTSIIGGSMCDNVSDGVQNNAVWVLLRWAIIILTAGIGIAAVGGIVYGSILYTSAGDKPEQTKKAISVITNTAIGLLLYVFMFAIINFLIPGGVIGTGGSGGGSNDPPATTPGPTPPPGVPGCGGPGQPYCLE